MVMSFIVCIYMFSNRKHINTFNINTSPYLQKLCCYFTLLLCTQISFKHRHKNMVNYNHIMRTRNVGMQHVTHLPTWDRILPPRGDKWPMHKDNELKSG